MSVEVGYHSVYRQLNDLAAESSVRAALEQYINVRKKTHPCPIQYAPTGCAPCHHPRAQSLVAICSVRGTYVRIIGAYLRVSIVIYRKLPACPRHPLSVGAVGHPVPMLLGAHLTMPTGRYCDNQAGVVEDVRTS